MDVSKNKVPKGVLIKCPARPRNMLRVSRWLWDLTSVSIHEKEMHNCVITPRSMAK